MGYLYQRRQRDGTKGGPWWIRIYQDGRRTEESTRTTSEKEARRIMTAKEGRLALGERILPRLDRVRYEEAAADLRTYWQTSGKRKLREADTRLKPLAKFFTGRRLVAINNLLAQRYVEGRQAEGRSNGTINRELTALGKMLRYAEENGKLSRVPRIHLLEEARPRSGFFERADFESVRKHLAKRPDLQCAITLAYTFGWRVQEILSLSVHQVDADLGVVRLFADRSKNKDPRTIYLTPEALMMVREQLERVRVLSRKLDQVIPHPILDVVDYKADDWETFAKPGRRPVARPASSA